MPMPLKVRFAAPSAAVKGVLAVGVVKDGLEAAPLDALTEAQRAQVTKAAAARRFHGALDQSLSVVLAGDEGLDEVILLGLGPADAVDDSVLHRAGGVLTAAAKRLAAVTLVLPALPEGSLNEAAAAAHVALGARLRSYRFDAYRTQQSEDAKPKLERLTVIAQPPSAAKTAFAPLDAVAEGVCIARDLVSEPPNVLYPESFAKRCQDLAKLGLEVVVLGEKEMRKLGMNTLLAVGQGSARESKLVAMHWRGGPEDQAPVAFVGKGVTFDTGGISLKPAGGMEDMKFDMGGAAAVTGAMAALAARGARVNAVGVIGLVENMPSGNAQRPSDVVISMSGQTVEVINTDAEGRLVLADALWYTLKTAKPQMMVDLATLTGAILVALGNEYAGLFSSDDTLAERITTAGQDVNEPVWRFPLADAYDKMLTSDIADMKNIGERNAGSITAAQFLKRFTDGIPWAHIDIAGTAWTQKDRPVTPKGATGFGVQLLDRLVGLYYESTEAPPKRTTPRKAPATKTAKSTKTKSNRKAKR